MQFYVCVHVCVQQLLKIATFIYVVHLICTQRSGNDEVITFLLLKLQKQQQQQQQFLRKTQ